MVCRINPFCITAVVDRRGTAALVLLACLVQAVSCTGTRPMAIEEAKTVSLAISRSEAIQPPPRRALDILALLSRPGTFDTAVADRFRARLKEPPPETSGAKKMVRYYTDHGRIAMEMGQGKQALDDLRTGRDLAKQAGLKSPELLFRLGMAEANFGNIRTGIEYIEQSQALKPTTRNFQKLVELYLKIGDFHTAPPTG